MQIAFRHQQQDIQDEPGALLGAHVLHQPVLEVSDEGGLLQAHCNDMLVRDHDAHRQRGVNHSRLVLFHRRDVHDNEGLSVLAFNTGGLLFVQGRPQKRGFHAQGGGHCFQFFLTGIGQIDPAAVLHGFQGGDFSINGLVNGQHAFHTFPETGKGHKKARAVPLQN